MRIGINFLPYSMGYRGGAEVYLLNIARKLVALYPNYDWKFYGDYQLLATFTLEKNQKIVPLQWGMKNRVERIMLEQTWLAWRASYDQLDCLLSNYVSPVLSRIPVITIVHDMLLKRYPDLIERPKRFYWNIMLPTSIRHSASVVTVSQFSKQEILNFYPFAQHKIFVTVEGINPTIAQFKKNHRNITSDLSSPYLLCVSSFGQHKNLTILLEALSSLNTDLSDLQLIFVGSANTPDAIEYLNKMRTHIALLGIQEKVHFLGHVTAEKLAMLYQQAVAVVIPSLYEGFGLPVIEAQFFETPVLCANTASLPEIAGNSAIFFDPHSSQTLKKAILTLVNSANIQQEIIQQGMENIQRFTWEHAAQQMMTAIKHAIH